MVVVHETKRRFVAVTSDAVAPRGYFVIRARDLDEAIAIAKDCPQLRHGGCVVLRPIDPSGSSGGG